MTELDVYEDISNPLDSVEEIFSRNDWVFDRMNEDELTVQISGKMGEYTLFFLWQEEHSALQFSCRLDIDFAADNIDVAAKTLSAINASLWLGHFDICHDSRTPRFRHTSLFRGSSYSSGADHIQDLVDIALAECERYYPTFHLLSASGSRDENALGLAMMDSCGMA